MEPNKWFSIPETEDGVGKLCIRPRILDESNIPKEQKHDMYSKFVPFRFDSFMEQFAPKTMKKPTLPLPSQIKEEVFDFLFADRFPKIKRPAHILRLKPEEKLQITSSPDMEQVVKKPFQRLGIIYTYMLVPDQFTFRIVEGDMLQHRFVNGQLLFDVYWDKAYQFTGVLGAQPVYDVLDTYKDQIQVECLVGDQSKPGDGYTMYELTIRILCVESDISELDRVFMSMPGIQYESLRLRRSDFDLQQLQEQSSALKHIYIDDLNLEAELMQYQVPENLELAKKPVLLSPALNMHEYQLYGVSWMLFRENPPDVIVVTEQEYEQQHAKYKDCGLQLWVSYYDVMEGKTMYRNPKTQLCQDEYPTPCRGGILADDMGLGKTLQLLATICATSHFTALSSSMFTNENEVECDSFARRQIQGPTLIVCPPSVKFNWVRQIQQHIQSRFLRGRVNESDSPFDPPTFQPNEFTVYEYYDQLKHVSAEELRRYDVIITTYNVLAEEHKNMTGTSSHPLFEIKFHRVILDEAHYIANAKTKRAKGAFDLQSDIYWAVSGTPMQNTVKNFFSLFRFLGLHPLSNEKYFGLLIEKPINTVIKRNKKKKEEEKERKDRKEQDIVREEKEQIAMTQALHRLRTVLSLVCLRRMKNMQIQGKPLLQLPEKTIEDIHIELNPREQQRYNELSKIWDEFAKRIERDEIGKNMSTVLTILMRCENMKFNYDNFETLYTKFDIASVDEDECVICDAVLGRGKKTPYVLECGHIYCCDKCLNKCVPNTSPESSASAALSSTTEPVHRYICLAKEDDEDVCNKPSSVAFTQKELFELMREEKKVIETAKLQPKSSKEAVLREGNSDSCAKIDFMIRTMNRHCEQDPTAKAVVFSQWSSFLFIVKNVLEKHGIGYELLTGAIPSKDRARAMQAFERDPSKKFFLVALQAGGQGINLVSANVEFMMDLWWNPATEDQAIDRVHRIGQTKPVTVYRLIAKNTIEEKVNVLQQSKRKLLNAAFHGNADRLGSSNLTAEDLANLLSSSSSSQEDNCIPDWEIMFDS